MTDPEERLIGLLDQVNEWLKFAETKNGGITAISGLAATAVLGYLTDLKHPSQLERWGLSVACLLFVVSVILAILSFFPQIDPAKVTISRGPKGPQNLNLFFFGHLAGMSGEELAQQLLELVGVTERKPTMVEQQLADQVVINSRITSQKLSHFALSARAFLAAVVLSAVVILLSRTPWF